MNEQDSKRKQIRLSPFDEKVWNLIKDYIEKHQGYPASEADILRFSLHRAADLILKETAQ